MEIYNSKTRNDFLELKAPYYNAILPTTVFYENEKIFVNVDSLGHIEFFDEGKNSLGFVDVPAAESPDMYGHSGQYGEMKCGMEGENICLELPVYGWNDDYPYCDGESDRWTRYIARWFKVVFDVENRKIEIIGK